MEDLFPNWVAVTVGVLVVVTLAYLALSEWWRRRRDRDDDETP